MNKNTRRLVESAVLLAIALVLGELIKFEGLWIKGGSITAASMLPLVLISYRHGWKWGTFSAFVYSVLQAIIGAKNLGYAPDAITWIGILLLDYIIAFSVIGLASLFRNINKNQLISIIISVCITFGLRFLCHFISGWIIWQALWPAEGWLPWSYSFVYNAGYMVPEIIITSIVIAASYPSLKKFWELQS